MLDPVGTRGWVRGADCPPFNKALAAARVLSWLPPWTGGLAQPCLPSRASGEEGPSSDPRAPTSHLRVAGPLGVVLQPVVTWDLRPDLLTRGVQPRRSVQKPFLLLLGFTGPTQPQGCSLCCQDRGLPLSCPGLSGGPTLGPGLVLTLTGALRRGSSPS